MAKQVVIMDKGERIILPVLKEEAIYNRLRRDEAIEIVNDRNESVFVSADDIFVVNRIYYGYNQSILTGNSREQLDNLAMVLMRNPALGVDIHAYTDSRGTLDDNRILSQSRAESVVDFLESKGIARDRMKAIGMGETGLLNHCADGVQCPEEMHAINRRTEIKFRDYGKW
jgi:outer membrane protein OmpA-like peptidoglycan-associated protein